MIENVNKLVLPCRIGVCLAAEGQCWFYMVDMSMVGPVLFRVILELVTVP